MNTLKQAAHRLLKVREDAAGREEKFRDMLHLETRVFGSITAMAAKLGVSIPYLSDVRRGNRPVSDKFLGKVLEVARLGCTEPKEDGD